MIRRLRKWWLCWRYHLCPTHGTLMTEYSGYSCTSWVCEVCVEENRGRTIQRNQGKAMARVRAKERLDRDWQIPRKEFE